jgi:DNA-directed RNA polymerase II subunit RPB7
MAATEKKDPINDMILRYTEEKKLQAHVSIPPHSLRYNLQFVIQDRLERSVRGKCTEENGFILQMKRITEVKGGLLDKKTGTVHYNVDFIAQTLRPQVGDIIEAVVTKVFKIGVFADLGPLNIFIPLSRMPEQFQFQTHPVPQFVVENDVSQTIKPGSELQLKIEKIAMLDDNFLPSNSTCCVLKSMGALIGVQSSLRTQRQSGVDKFLSKS